MNVTLTVVLWLIGSALGIILTLYMFLDSFMDRRSAENDTQRAITYAWTWQWAIGMTVKSLLFMLGIWAMFLPDGGEAPSNVVSEWAATNGRFLFTTTLLLVVYLMDTRDLVLVVMKIKGRSVMGMDAALRAIGRLRRI